MPLKQKYNPISGKFDYVDIAPERVHTQTMTTVSNVITQFPDSLSLLPNNTSFYFKTEVIGKQTAAPGDGTIGNAYSYTIDGVVENILGVINIRTITGTIWHEGFSLFADPITGHAVTVTTTGTDLDFSITGLIGGIDWKAETRIVSI